jgi:putative FmdB family regulatory protein
MPLLEYRCAACEKKAEFLVLAGDSRVAPRCPACGKSGMTRLLSTFAAHAGRDGGKDVDTMCGDGPCAMPGMCGPSACGLDEN